MTYKTGEVPQLGDTVMGTGMRGAVIGLRDAGRLLLQRRAPYEGPDKPMKLQYDEVASEDFKLVYRHKAAAVGVVDVKVEKKSRKK